MTTSRIGPFALEQPLGGSSGSVYRAIHVEQKLPVAIRLFSVPFGVGDVTKRGFVDEASTLKTLKHPNIARCYGGAIAEDQAYLAYEFIEGETLADLIAKRGRLSWEHVVEIASQIASGLEFAHEKKIVHQALLPDKILLTEAGNVKIIDYRTERHGGLNPPVSLSVDRVTYLTPEQVTPDGAITERTDVYAFGCILYHMLSGTPPFVSADPKELAQMHRQVVPPRVSTKAMDCPVYLDKLVEQMLQKDPNKRPYTAAAVRLALEETQKNIAEGRGVAEHASSGVSALRMGQDREEARGVLGRNKKKRAQRKQADVPFYENVWFLVGALVLLIVAVGVMMIPPSEEKLWSKAQPLLKKGTRTDTRRAVDDYLKPMLDRFPEGKYSEDAQRHVDEFAMDTIEGRIKRYIRIGRDPKNANEARLLIVWRYVVFGDNDMANKKCQLFLDSVEDIKKNKVLRMIAEQQIAEHTEPPDSAEYLDKKLAEASDKFASQDYDGAAEIWTTIVALYPDEEFATHVSESRSGLDEIADSRRDE